MAFRERFGAGVVDVVQCMSGSDFEKGTSLIADPTTALALDPAGRIPCLHKRGTHREQACGYDERGESRSARAAAYPAPMNEWLAAALTTGDEAEVRRLVEAAADRVVQEIRAGGGDAGPTPAQFLAGGLLHVATPEEAASAGVAGSGAEGSGGGE